MKTLSFYITCVFLLTTSAFLSVFLVANILKFDNKSAKQSGNESRVLSIKWIDNSVNVPFSKFITTTDDLNSSSGNNIFKILASDVINTNSSSKVKINLEALKMELPFEVSDINYALVQDGNISNCESNSYNIQFDEDRINSLLNNSEEDSVVVDLNDLLKVHFNDNIITLCNRYNSEKVIISNLLNEYFTDDVTENIMLNIVFSYEGKWSVTDASSIINILTLQSENFNIKQTDGTFELIDSRIALLTPYSVGRKLNADLTEGSFEIFLQTLDTNEFRIIYDEIEPNILSLGTEILDFTQLIGTGQTRIDLIRNGQGNSAVYFAEQGLAEIHNVIINPGEEFSYVKKINKRKGINYTTSGRLIGMGYCNSTTTLFRAALETGLPITDRSSHAENIASYDWGYAMNIVDAAFSAVEGSEIDLKFVNDFPYPILLRFEKVQDNNGYQYHTVNLYTSSKAVKRTVALSDWTKWDVYSSKSFKASFIRKVYENTKLLREDKFQSQYVEI